MVLSRFIILFFAAAFQFMPVVSFAQDADSYGIILSISEKNVSVHFENIYISFGDEVEFWRFTQMVDPVDGEVRGYHKTYIGKGVVDDVGVGKVQVTIIELESDKTIQMIDRVLSTGEGKSLQRKAKVGAIQDLTDDGELVIDLGSEDQISEGDEFLIQRFETIINPETKIMKVTRQFEIGRGKISSVGGNTSVASDIELLPGMELLETDNIVFPFVEEAEKIITTAEGKKMVRKTQVAAIQELEEDGSIVFDLGEEDEISEGDEFLIQRFETSIDPETKEMITEKVAIGKGKVNTVSGETSIGSIVGLLPGMELQDSDNIVFTRLEEEIVEEEIKEPSIVDRLQQQIDDLRIEVEILKTAVDSLGNEHTLFKTEIETVLSQLMAGDIRGTRILIKNDEPVRRKDSREVFEAYKQALDTCLRRDYKNAIELFRSFMKRYPDSKLSENCLYWIAQSDFSMGHYETALEGFKVVIDDARFKHKDDDAAIMTAITYYRLGKNEDSLRELQSFIQLYPSSEYRNRVDSWIRRLSS